MSDENVIAAKSKSFAIRIIHLYKFLVAEKKEYVMSKQILRSGTSIGANVRESWRAQSKADFCAKLHVSLKEAEETLYWLELLESPEYISKNQYQSLCSDGEELIRILVAILKTSKQEEILWDKA